MSTNPSLLIDLAGIARLADVRRPVASVWRTRFASAADPFPQAVTEKGGQVLFDGMSVAQWLARTEHGKNPDAVADVAASAAPADFNFTDASHVAAVDALLALRAASGEPVAVPAIDELQRRAVAIDPDDTCLLNEVMSARLGWPEWADLLADAAYSPLHASQLLERRHRTTASSAGSSGPLTAEAEAMLVAMAKGLTVGRQANLSLRAGVNPSLISELVSQLGDDVDIAVWSTPEERGIRRRLLCEGLALPAKHPLTDAPRLHIERLPSGSARLTSEMLQAVDELALGMRDDDRAIVLAPAGVLVESVALTDGLARTDVLRSGRVRAIIKLPAGLVTAAPREALALWVLGRDARGVPIADRVTAVADLTETTLAPATRADLTSDVLAAMGDARDVRSHAFRFARLLRTASLVASRGPLVAGGGNRKVAPLAKRDLPALLDQALMRLGEDAPRLVPATTPGPTVPTAGVDELMAQRHLRLFSGTRLEPDEFSESGLVVVVAEDLNDLGGIGARRVDPLAFAAAHPSARLTAAGDVVFRTAPTAKAWVDPDGSKVVAYPARVLRIDRADPGGLVPEVVADDINRSRGGPASWRRWRLRRVAPQVAEPLRLALAELATRREALTRRNQALNSYSELLTAGVVSGVVTLTDHAADAASDH
jgi:hypothetical protein